MRLQSAIFDMDGTLLDSMHIWREIGPRMLRARGLEPAPDLGEHLKPMTAWQGAAYCREAYRLPETVEEVYAQIEEQVKRFYENEVTAKPGVKKVLSLLKMEGVWMYVATATDRHLAEEALRHAGIRDYFRGLVTSAETGVGKDVSPEIYERAMRRLRSNKKDTVIFEDALHAIRTAKAAGFRVAAIYDPSAQEDQAEIRSLADYYFRSFEELFEAKSLE